MSANRSKVMSEALSLNAEERAELAAELLQSLETAEITDIEQIERAWAEEIAKRCADLDSGNGTTTDWSEARRKIEKEFLQK